MNYVDRMHLLLLQLGNVDRTRLLLLELNRTRLLLLEPQLGLINCLNNLVDARIIVSDSE